MNEYTSLQKKQGQENRIPRKKKKKIDKKTSPISYRPWKLDKTSEFNLVKISYISFIDKDKYPN